MIEAAAGRMGKPVPLADLVFMFSTPPRMGTITDYMLTVDQVGLCEGSVIEVHKRKRPLSNAVAESLEKEPNPGRSGSPRY